jgi:hypothetical protein
MPPKLPLPRGWKRRVRSSLLHTSARSSERLGEIGKADTEFKLDSGAMPE